MIDFKYSAFAFEKFGDRLGRNSFLYFLEIKMFQARKKNPLNLAEEVEKSIFLYLSPQIAPRLV